MALSFANELKEENERKDSSSIGNSSGRRNYYKLTSDVDRCVFKKKGNYLFNVIPFKDNEGKFRTMLPTSVYANVGANKDSFLALCNYGKGNQDPMLAEKHRIEDEAQELTGKKAEWSRVKPYVPQKRAMMLLQPLDKDGYPIKGAKLQVHEGYYGDTRISGLAHMLVSKANECIMGRPVIDYASDTDGKIVSITVAEGTFNGRTTYDLQSVSFEDRKVPVTEEFIVNHGINLEAMLIMPTKEEIEASMFGTDVPPAASAPKADEGRGREEGIDLDDEPPAREMQDPSTGNTYSDPFADLPTEQESKPAPEVIDAGAVDFDRSIDDEPQQDTGKCPFGHPWGETLKHKPDCNKCAKADFMKCKGCRKA